MNRQGEEPLFSFAIYFDQFKGLANLHLLWPQVLSFPLIKPSNVGLIYLMKRDNSSDLGGIN